MKFLILILVMATVLLASLSSIFWDMQPYSEAMSVALARHLALRETTK